jgi:RHS repeat-associated protein
VKAGVINPIEADHLGSPRNMQATAGTSSVWTWNLMANTATGSNAFGEQASTGTVTDFNLRFPGQYADGNGLSYNYFRDYEAGSGRYVESDPIGLDGGINTFAYVKSNPSNRIDPKGWVSVNVGFDAGFMIPGTGGGASGTIGIDSKGWICFQLYLCARVGMGEGVGIGGRVGVGTDFTPGEDTQTSGFGEGALGGRLGGSYGTGGGYITGGSGIGVACGTQVCQVKTKCWFNIFDLYDWVRNHIWEVVMAFKPTYVSSIIAGSFIMGLWQAEKWMQTKGGGSIYTGTLWLSTILIFFVLPYIYLVSGLSESAFNRSWFFEGKAERSRAWVVIKRELVYFISMFVFSVFFLIKNRN